MTGHHLLRVGHFGTQLFCSMPSPAGIIHGYTTDSDKISLAGRNDLFRLARICDESHRHHRHARFLTDEDQANSERLIGFRAGQFQFARG